MPVKKFKTFEEAERDLWCFEPDERYFKRVCKMFRRAKELYNPSYPKGVHKYRTIEEAQQDMDKWRSEYIKEQKLARESDIFNGNTPCPLLSKIPKHFGTKRRKA